MAASEDPPYTRLRQLQQLKDSGLMTEAEFAERRNQMLADL